jgi:hypothetical protein
MSSGKDHPAYPIVELAARTRTLNIGDNPASLLRMPATMRTGCAGTTWASASSISCSIPTRSMPLKSRQTASGLRRRLHQPRPDRHRVGEILRRPFLPRKALAHPNNARALYYMALVERRASHSKRKWPISSESSKCTRSHATHVASSASPTISRIKPNSRWSSLKRCRSHRSG